MSVPMDNLRLDQIEAGAQTCPDACAADAIRLVVEVRRLRAALKPFAHHALPGWDTRSEREYRISVTEGQVACAWTALNEEVGP